jgi:hypothetical protein
MNELERAPLAGERYETVAPDTLDLAERARMAINGLLGICDPNMDFMPYGVFHLDCRRPHLAHWASADNTCGTKILESIPLLRLMSGSEQHLDLEAGMRDAFMSRIRDGHFWDVVDPRRPWRNIYNDSEKRYGKGKDEDFSVPIATARMMRTILVYRQLTGDKAFDKLAAEMSAALCRIAVVKDDYAYYPEKGGWCEPTAYPQSGYLNFDEAQCDQEGAEGSILCYQGSQIYAVSHWYKLTGDERALELARRLTRYCMKPKFWGGRPDPDPQSRVRSGLFIETGFIAPPLPDPAWSAGPEMGHWCSHFHARAIAVRGMLEYAMAANDARTLEFVRRFYEFSLTQGIAKIGYIDTHPSSTDARAAAWATWWAWASACPTPERATTGTTSTPPSATSSPSSSSPAPTCWRRSRPARRSIPAAPTRPRGSPCGIPTSSRESWAATRPSPRRPAPAENP